MVVVMQFWFSGKTLITSVNTYLFTKDSVGPYLCFFLFVCLFFSFMSDMHDYAGVIPYYYT